MAIWAGITSLSFRQLLVLAGAFISNPSYLLPTYRATKETIEICNHLFGRQHHGNNRTNAFRHAFWNYKICQRCLITAGSPPKAVDWSKKITDLHEELLPNDELSKTMDLHNNTLGRKLFLRYNGTDTDVIPILKTKMEMAKKITDIKEVDSFEDQLVFTEN